MMDRNPSGLKTYLNEISRNPVMTKEEEYAIFERLRNGDTAVRQEIVERNLRLVVRLALKYQGKGLSLEDLVQEGNIGLLEVIERFDHNLGFRFSTYAAFWIRQAIQVALRKQGSLIRLPVRKARSLGYISEIVHEYQSTKGRMPTAGELSERLGMKEDQLDELLCISRTTLSLDTPLDDDGGTLGERVEDRETPLPSQRSMRNEMVAKVNYAVRQLSDREHSIIRLRFGLGGHRERSLRSVSRRVGLSQEGVRRVEQRALAKLGRANLRNQLTGLL
jgi:RNA polymerase sigma factor (sigma-70 family)